MSKDKKALQGVKPPSALYTAAAALVRAFIWILGRFRVVEETPLPREGPLVVLCSHEGMADFLFMAAAVRRKMHYVGSRRFFEQRPLGAILRSVGVVPKIQFHPDPRCIATLLRITKGGGCVCLFPAGQTSMSGVPGHISPSVVRLVRKMGATVAYARIHGSFFTMPRFAAGHINRGTVEVRLGVLYSPEGLAAVTDGEAMTAIRGAIDYNEYAWQEATGHLFRGRHRTRGYDGVLYACPRCQSHDQMTADGNRFYCAACGNTAFVGRDMHFYKTDERCVIFPTLLDWYRWQEAEVFGRVDDTATPFLLETAAEAAIYEGTRPKKCGTGTLRMDREGMYFTGRIKEQEVSLGIRHATMPGLVAETGQYLEVYDNEWGLVRYYPQRPQAVTLWKIAQEYIYSKIHEE